MKLEPSFARIRWDIVNYYLYQFNNKFFGILFIFTGLLIVLGALEHAIWYWIAVHFLCYALENILCAWRMFYYIKTQRHEVLYLWSYGSTSKLGPVGQRDDKPAKIKSPINPDWRTNVLFLQNRVRSSLSPALDLVSLAPPPSSEMSERESDYLWPLGVYMLRPQKQEEWRESVRHFALRSLAIIIECRTLSDSFRWELSELLRDYPLGKILLVCEREDEEVAFAARELILNANLLREQDGMQQLVEIPVISREEPFTVAWEFSRAVQRWVYKAANLDPLTKRKNTCQHYNRLLVGAVPIWTNAVLEKISGFLITYNFILIVWHALFG